MSHGDIYNIVFRTYNDHYEFFLSCLLALLMLQLILELNEWSVLYAPHEVYSEFLNDIIIYSYTFIDYVRHL